MRLRDLYERAWTEKSESSAAAFAPGDRSTVALAALPGGSSLLDVGCGEGAFLEAASAAYGHVVGVDISSRALAAARKRKLDVLQCDLNETYLPFSDGSFHTVVSLDVIEHVLEPDAFMLELSRVTEPGGWTIISTPNIRYIKHLFTLLVRGHFPHTSQDRFGYDGGHLHYFTRRDILSLMAAADTQPVRSVGIIPSKRLTFLRPIAGTYPVTEWLSAGLLVIGRKRPHTGP